MNYKSIILTGLAFLVFACQPPARQPAPAALTQSQADLFIKSLLSDSLSSEAFVHPTALATSQRLGIRYDDVPEKYLIQYDISSETRRRIRQDSLGYQINLRQEANGYALLNFTIDDPENNASQDFYFHNGYLISAVDFYTRNWQVFETRYFRFLVSNPKNHTPYAADLLDNFVEEMLERLQFDAADRQRLATQKIVYALCDSTAEVGRLTGFESRGTYILGFDQIVSTFNSHTHEVAHLLINFKLRELPLFTHPFMQEGFACAFGGRGGKLPSVINNLGAFLQESKFMEYREILTMANFRNNDASLTYPLSGIYNKFLFETRGLDEYLKLYRWLSGDEQTLSRRRFIQMLPQPAEFLAYLKEYSLHAEITFADSIPAGLPRLDGEWGEIYADSSFYYFNLNQSLLISSVPPADTAKFYSKEFPEIFKGATYRGEKYVLEVTENEIKVFNFYTAALDAFYSKGLTKSPHEFHDAEGFARFAIRKTVFDGNLFDRKISSAP